VRHQKEGTGTVSVLCEGGSREIIVVDPQISSYFLSRCMPSDAG
jgi:hypothetical protein